MQQVDIKKAFDIPSRVGVLRYIYDTLIENGYLVKQNERYFKPTEKLLDLAFLPDKLILNDFQSRWLSYNTSFNKHDLIVLFDDNKQIIKKMIYLQYFQLQRNGSYAKSAKFEQDLADGELEFSLTSYSIKRKEVIKDA